MVARVLSRLGLFRFEKESCFAGFAWPRRPSQGGISLPSLRAQTGDLLRLRVAADGESFKIHSKLFSIHFADVPFLLDTTRNH